MKANSLKNDFANLRKGREIKNDTGLPTKNATVKMTLNSLNLKIPRLN